MFKNYLRIGMMAMLAMSFIVMSSCDEDDPAAPTINLSETSIDAKAGETISVEVTFMSEAGAKSITVTKLWDGESQGSETVTGDDLDDDLVFDYEVEEDDADYVLTFNFLIEDNDGQTDEVELVVNVELTMSQLLVKYDWQFVGDILDRTDGNIAQAGRLDDVLRFNADGTYVWGFGSERDDFDNFSVYCTWDLNEETGLLRMSRMELNFSTFAYDVQKIDELTIATINDEVLESEIYTVEGLDVFDENLMPSEDVITKYSAIAKGSSFVPYIPDQAEPTGTCEAAPWD